MPVRGRPCPLPSAPRPRRANLPPPGLRSGLRAGGVAGRVPSCAAAATQRSVFSPVHAAASGGPPCLPPRDRGACQPVGGRVPCVPGWCPVFSSRRRERLCRHPRVDGTSCPLGRCRPGARPPGAGVAARPVVRTCQALPPWRARAPQGSPRLRPPLPERSACPCPRGRPLPSRGWCRCAAA